jgi:hypothetical protein
VNSLRKVIFLTSSQLHRLITPDHRRCTAAPEPVSDHVKNQHLRKLGANPTIMKREVERLLMHYNRGFAIAAPAPPSTLFQTIASLTLIVIVP